MLRRLEAEGLVSTGPTRPTSAGASYSSPDAGRAARQELDDRSEELAARIVAPLTDRQRERLTEALATADLLVRAATVRLREVAARRPRRPARRWGATSRRSTSGSRPATGSTVRSRQRAGPGSTYVLATSDGEPVAYGGIRPAPAVDERAVEIKRMWVHPDWRGAGLGSRMLRHLEALAGERGAHADRARHQRGARRGDRDVRAVRLPAGRALPRQRPARHPLLREGRSPADLGERVPVRDDRRQLAGRPQRELVVVVRRRRAARGHRWGRPSHRRSRSARSQT